MNYSKEKEKYGSNYIGNVIRITDSRTVIVNAGRDILSVGDTIQIYELLDPLTNIDGSFLANYEHVKDELKVIRVDNQYSICQKQETKTSPVILPVSPLFETTSYVPLHVDNSDIEPLYPSNPLVKIGDPIKKA